MQNQNNAEANKSLITDFFKFLEQGDVEKIRALISDNVRWWAQGKGVMTKDEFCTNTERNVALTTKRIATIKRLIAEGDNIHALVSTEFTFQDQRVLKNEMSLSGEIQNGQITNLAEFMDIDAVRAFFGG